MKEFLLVGAIGKNCFPVCEVRMMFSDRCAAVSYIFSNIFKFSNWSVLGQDVALVVDDEGFIVAYVDMAAAIVHYKDWKR